MERTPTLLLVDDEEANLDLLSAVLRPRGYTGLVRVSDARQAADAFVRAAPDLVLLDLHMPHRSGFEVLQELRELIPAGDFVPVLVLTADVTREAREKALAGGAHDYVTKPFDRTEVLLRVRNLLATRELHLAQVRARAAAEESAARDRLLADAGRLFGASLDTTTALAQLAHRLADGWVDACRVLLDGDEGIRCVAAAPTPAWVELDAPLHPDAGWGSVVQAPLQAGPHTLGWIELARTHERGGFSPEDESLARELGVRAAIAVENARSFQAAQNALAARDQVLAVVAHDLRSPLTAIRFEVEMLRSEPTAPLADQDERTLHRVEQAVTRMDRLIQDLLDVSRLNRGVLELEMAPRDPARVLSEAAEALRPMVEGQRLTFEVRGDDSLAPIALDAARLTQAVFNLVGNAVKFARHDGTVGLHWRSAPDGGLHIVVRDDGPGIEPEQLQQIFGAFWQARHADRRGLGLGLAIARAIVEAHGGRLWVESEVGRGSDFVISLPAAPGPDVPAAE